MSGLVIKSRLPAKPRAYGFVKLHKLSLEKLVEFHFESVQWIFTFSKFKPYFVNNLINLMHFWNRSLFMWRKGDVVVAFVLGNDGFMILASANLLLSYLTTKSSHERYLRFVQVFHSLRAWIMGNGKKIKWWAADHDFNYLWKHDQKSAMMMITRLVGRQQKIVWEQTFRILVESLFSTFRSPGGTQNGFQLMTVTWAKRNN